MTRLVPADYQPALPLHQLIVQEPPGPEAIELDVLFVGGGPASLSGAIELARLVQRDQQQGGGLGDIQIGVLEKGERLGDHCLSGAVVNPRAFRELFPELKDSDFPFGSPVQGEAVYLLSEQGQVRLPTPPTMKNHGFYVASLCEMVRWLGEKAEQLGVNLFAGYPAGALLVDGRRVIGARTTPSGLDRGGKPTSSHQPATDVTAKVTALGEGTRGLLTQAYLEWQEIPSQNPQVFALGVKELWETKRPLDRVIHTMGWPLPNDAFGGSFMYPLQPTVVALGLVVGLGAPDAGLDVHVLLQQLKLHALFRRYLEGGELLEWGAKTIPEGGYYALPARRAIFRALKRGDTSAAALAEYDAQVDASFIRDDLYRTRNMRLAFKGGFYVGGIKAGLMTLTGGRFPGGRIAMPADAKAARNRAAPASFTPDGKLTFSKLDAVFRSGNATRDTIPAHLIPRADVPRDVAELYTHMCPAGVYEWVDGSLRINPPNCVDCKATDVLGPRWTPREGGSGPRYKRM
ncbi:MAG: 4Fe-4S dicluster domain-containing protein [Gemmatimonadetes bacterium]|nr:4Fe-4S dicluster domain-containing protein [Gemmatimonadota bacterium]